ncbi:MAG: two-component system, LytTR family, sensor kinase [Acidobacteriota bacterium]|jgi:signal transduction histidine kinase|nr:two-component system, LytTR family, sensor kinase [Acidobacteriota bacterium]
MRLFDAEGGGWGGRRWARLGFIWGVWALVGLFFSSQIYFYFLHTEKQLSLPRSLAWQMSAVVVFALSTPLVLRLARRYPFERHAWWRALIVHLLAGTAISAAWATYHITLDFAFEGNYNSLKLASFPRLIFIHLDKELLVYWIIVVISHAVDYYQRYREGELRASQAQLQALKMQLHPHFLFNALHSISALVHIDPEAADKMIARLGDFLRLTLETSAAQEVPLRQEIEFLNCYLEIERIRFQDRLTTRLEVDPQVLDCRVPNLILQPIVENAIRHGVAPRSAPGHVHVRAARAGSALRLEVRDNGRGLPEGAVAVRCATPQQQGGVGLSNTRARLQQLYGSAYRFEIANDPSGGVVVTMEIPLHGSTVEPERLAASLGLEVESRAARPTGTTRPVADTRTLSTRA